MSCGGRNAGLPENLNKAIVYDPVRLRRIWLAGGCFWGVQAFMARVPGVADTVVGYANGHVPEPTYRQVCTGLTGHAETVEVAYDPGRISLIGLLDRFFSIIDPVSVNKQGEDTGTQYRTGIYYRDPADGDAARAFIADEQARYSRPIAVEVLPLSGFYPAEEYHQDYLEKNPGGYCHVDMGKLGLPPR